MSKVTVLTAAYNAEAYLHTCLDSLLRQTLHDIQIVCVDDGSSDATPQLLDDYAARDSRVEVVHLKENGGQAYARNVALQRAKGDYVCMLDSDDWLADDALMSAFQVFQAHPHTDSVLFHVREMYPDGHYRDYPMPPFVSMTGEEAFEASLTWQIHGLYMVRADIHRRFPYDDSAKSYSDDNTTRIHYLNSREVRQCGGVYFYRQHSASVTHRVSVRRFDYLRANESMKRQMQEAHVPERLMDVYENVRWLNLIDVYMFYFHHRSQLLPEHRSYGLAEMRRVWGNIELTRLRPRNRIKFGYMPLRPSWLLFRCQEELYFTLRKLLFHR